MSANEQGQYWHDKGGFWFMAAIAAVLPGVVILPLQFEIEDPFWSWTLAALQGAIVVAQIAAAVRMTICYRRAERAWRERGVS